jgi:hypothetical protein
LVAVAVTASETRPLERADARPIRARPDRRLRPALAERITLNVVVGAVAALLAFVLARNADMPVRIQPVCALA